MAMFRITKLYYKNISVNTSKLCLKCVKDINRARFLYGLCVTYALKLYIF